MDEQAGGDALEPVGPSVVPAGGGRRAPNVPVFRITVAAAAVVAALGLLLSGTSARATSRTTREQLCLTEAQFASGAFAVTNSPAERDRQQLAFAVAVRRCSARLRALPLPTTTSTTSTTDFLNGP